jgi:hypothetical protein
MTEFSKQDIGPQRPEPVFKTNGLLRLIYIENNIHSLQYYFNKPDHNTHKSSGNGHPAGNFLHFC